MNLIVVVDKNWAIGYKNKLLCHLPSDLKHFKKMTSGKAVIMGRKTLESLPGSKPLPNRTNIVLSRNYDNRDGIIVINNIFDLKKVLSTSDLSEAFVIGGQAVYELLLPYTSCAFITKIDSEFKADAYFPNLDKMENWQATQEISTISENNLNATIYKYENSDVKGNPQKSKPIIEFAFK